MTIVDLVQRTVAVLKPGYTPGWALSQAGRKKRYGDSEAAVRKRLVRRVWKGKTFWIHELEVGRFDAFTADVDKHERTHRVGGRRPNYVLRVVYTFCWRLIRGSSTTLSNHSFGIAFDLNPTQNPMGPTLVTDLPAYIPVLAKKHGIRWGGTYSGRKDAMHFEL